MFDVNKRGQAAAFLRLRNDRERERCFSRRFRTEHFNDATARESADAQSAIDQDVAGRDDINVDDLFGTQAHDRAFAVVFGNLLNGEVEILVSRCGYLVGAGFFFSFRGHS